MIRLPLRVLLSVSTAMTVGVVLSGEAGAVEPCAVLAPGADGVLRLDSAAGGRAAGCGTAGRAYRAYDALPEAFENRPSRPKVGPVQAQPQPPTAVQSEAQPQAQPQSQAAASAQPQVAARSEERTATDASREDVARLKTETARLKGEMARLSDETARLRAETVRLRNELASREAPASTATVAPAARAPQAGAGQASKAESGVPAGKIVAKVDAGSGATAVAPKGDLLVTAPQASEVAKTLPDNKTSPDKKSDALPLDEHAFERQKGVVERAWKQLLDLAGRMKSDVSSGKPE
ncbi:MAG: hypothetical protein AB1586_02520 [Pseudomonadota bacterium]